MKRRDVLELLTAGGAGTLFGCHPRPVGSGRGERVRRTPRALGRVDPLPTARCSLAVAFFTEVAQVKQRVARRRPAGPVGSAPILHLT